MEGAHPNQPKGRGRPKEYETLRKENQTLSFNFKALLEAKVRIEEENQILKMENQTLSSNLEAMLSLAAELREQARDSGQETNELRSLVGQLQNDLGSTQNELKELRGFYQGMPIFDTSDIGTRDYADCSPSELEMLPRTSEEDAQKNNCITSYLGSTSQAATCYYTSTNIAQFMMKLDENEKSNVSWADFPNLQAEQRILFEQYNIPFSLLSTAKAIKEMYGDISQNISLSRSVIETSYIFFCATIKEIMHDWQLEQVTEAKLLKWRDAINVAKYMQLHVDFAWRPLKMIAYAYFGMQQMQYQKST